MNVGQLVVKKIVSLPLTSTMREVAKTMRENDVSSVLLVDDMGGIVSIVTERDITKAVAEGMDYSTPATKLGNSPVISVERETSLVEALEVMGEKRIRHLVVTDEGKPLGVVSLREIANTLTVISYAETSY
ncbi:CBS domain-containing protein [Metallosphaera hakonensis]|uniref:CBS domain-containing protein n=1 Tax=Metallosphaera hakonensis JCM 8857 = DSM 7519 TaxID=1293036 RepID=A0A2U9IWD2_9CREN|nr:CBS domain-containing protein [Metallosphaera hakonensis]AWS00392.1 CBS domain-containing protein [Metallosphaera hakonensis JCM 8857 = DSM 7519]